MKLDVKSFLSIKKVNPIMKHGFYIGDKMLFTSDSP